MPQRHLAQTRPVWLAVVVTAVLWAMLAASSSNNNRIEQSGGDPAFFCMVSGFSLLQRQRQQQPQRHRQQLHYQSRVALSNNGNANNNADVAEEEGDPTTTTTTTGKTAAAVIAAMAEEVARENRKKDGATMEELMDPYLECQYESYFDGTKPDASWNLAYYNFLRQGKEIIKQGLQEITNTTTNKDCRPPACLRLQLSNAAVKETEERRINSGGAIEAHPVSQALYDVGCLILDNVFDGRPIQRFWFLETIARIPYFSYVSMLHLYESFGWFRAVELRKVHAAEDWNELHHLLIMESLGGNAQWSDRFLGYHVAFAYYWFLVVVYLGSPRIAYQFMELLEAHAVDTYTTFIRENRPRLRQLPPPAVAKSYYQTGDLYLFDAFQTTRPPGSRRPPCDTLLDVFENIAIDEGEHVKTMQACQEYAQFGNKVVSPHLKYYDVDELDNTTDEHARQEYNRRTNDYKRLKWKEWSDMLNNDNLEENEMEGMDTGNEMSPF